MHDSGGTLSWSGMKTRSALTPKAQSVWIGVRGVTLTGTAWNHEEETH
jgi:hypothetical protein